MTEPATVYVPPSAVRATFLLGATSLAGVFCSALAVKVVAVTTGPAGLGAQQLLRNIAVLGAIVGGMGLATNIVKRGSVAYADQDHAGLARLRASSSRLAMWTCVVSGLTLLAAAHPLGLAFAGTLRAVDFVALAVSVPAVVVQGIASAQVNARRRTAALARLNLLIAISTASATAGFIGWRGRDGIGLSVAAGAVSGMLSALWVERRTRPPVEPMQMMEPVGDKHLLVRPLARSGMVLVGSALLGSGTTYILPSVVLITQDVEAVGLLQASSLMAVGYLGLLLTTLGQDFYPRLSAASNDSTVLSPIMNEQLRILMLIGVPTLLCLSAFAGPLLVLAYSPAFGDAAGILAWQLLGDAFKFVAWIYAFLVLAKCRSPIYFRLELFAGVALLSFTSLLPFAFGLTGLGMGYAATMASYSLLALLLSRRVARIVLHRRLKWALAISIVGLSAGVMLDSSQILLRALLSGVCMLGVVGLLFGQTATVQAAGGK